MISDFWVKVIGNWLGCWIRKIWINCTFQHKSRFWWNFTMTFLETFHTKNAVNKHIFMLVTHTAYSNAWFCRYGFLKSGYGAELISDRMDRWVNFSGLRPRNRESWRALFTDSVDYMTSFLAPTHTNVFGKHNNSYGHLKTADVWSFTDYWKSDSLMASKLVFDFRNDENYDFF
jgi:hypothetical protein